MGAAQIPTERPSVTMTLEDRYNSQKVGGAFDVKATLAIKDHMPILDSFMSARWTKAGFKVKMTSGEYNDKALNFINSTGWTNKKYKP